MKRQVTRIISAALAIMLLASCLIIPVSAEQQFTYRASKKGTGASSSYQSGKYYQNLTKLTLTGDGRTDALAVALSQLGYQESNSGSSLSGTVSGSSNYTEFCYNTTNSNSYAWCAAFCSWALYQSRVSNHNQESDMYRSHMGSSSYYWCEIYCPYWVTALSNAGYYKKSAYYGGGYTPQSGDLIFFYSSSGEVGHIGMVVYTDGSYVYTVEGNTSDSAGVVANGGGVYFKSYALNYSRIAGYGALPYQSNSAVPKIDYSGNNPTAGYWITNTTKYLYADENCTTRATYTDGTYCNLPRFTMFEATGVVSGKKVLKVNYDGVNGYIAVNSDRVIQISSKVNSELMEAKNKLQYGINVVSQVSFKNYTEANLKALRTAYYNAYNVFNNSAATVADCNNAYSALETAYFATGVNENASTGVAVSGMNRPVTNGDCIVYTPSFGPITTATANHSWTVNVHAKWDSTVNGFVVKSVSLGDGENTPSVTLAVDEIFIAAHSWEEGIPADQNPVAGSHQNALNLYNTASGTNKVVYLSGIDTQYGFYDLAPYVNITQYGSTTEPDPEPTPDPGLGTNIALNKTYTVSGTGDGFIYDDPEWGLAQYQAKLTDGVASQTGTFSNDWFAFYYGAATEMNTVNGIGTIVIDLAGNYDISAIRANMWNNNGGGNAPSSVMLSVSQNGTSFTSIGSLPITTDEGAVYWAKTDIASATGRYVKLEFALNGTYCFLNEIEVYGTASTAHVHSAASNAWQSDGTYHWHVCSCGEKIDRVAHTPGGAATCQSAQTCTICNYVLASKTEHTPVNGNWTSDANYHWHVCSCGTALDKDSHDTGIWVIEGTTKKLYCTACNYLIKTESVPTDNIAFNKTYTVSGTGDGFIYEDPNYGLAQYQAKLTDGLAHEAGIFTNDWFAFYNGDVAELNTVDGVGIIVIDLEKKYDITKFRVNMWNNSGAGANAPASVKVSVSEDNATFTSVGSLPVDSTDMTVYWSELTANASGRYVKLEFALNGTYCFLNEIEVYGTEAADHSHSAVGLPWQSDVTYHWHVCSCGETLDKATHQGGAWVVVTPAQIGVDGKKEQRCVSCNYLVDEETIPALEEEHTHSAVSNAWQSDVSYHWHLCQCGEPVDKTVHDNGAWTIVGTTRELRCTVCNYLIKSESIADNIAFNKTYTVSGTGDGFIYDDPEWGLAQYQAKLTDGIALGEGTFTNDWFAFYNGAATELNTVDGVGIIVIDLEKKYDISSLRVNMWNNNDANANAPTSVKVSVSDNNTSFTSVGTLGIDSTDMTVYWAQLSPNNASGRYVKLEFTLAGMYCFLNEIEIYGIESASHIHSATSNTWQSDVNYHWHTCSCGEAFDKATHQGGAWVVVTPAQIGVDGKKEQRCVSCNYLVDEEIIPALEEEHSHSAVSSAWQSDVNYHWHACSCGEALDKATHQGGAWVVVTPAQIGVDGKKEQRCVSCNYLVDEEIIPALKEEVHSHTPVGSGWYNDKNTHWHVCSCGEIIDEASHTPGAEADCDNPQICTICNFVIKKATGHDVIDENTETTCNANGHSFVCSCGEVLDTEKHDDGKWVTTKEATETEEGEKELRCTVCGYAMETQSIPKTQPDTTYPLGDVNRSGALDMMDYILLKRNYFGTFQFDEEQLALGDVNHSGAIDMMDYILLKRAYFGTFTLQ